jgi:radical SAM modification target selenobiotic family peptide
VILFFYHLENAAIRIAFQAFFSLGGKRIFYLGDLTMDTKELKKILAGVGVVGLLAGGSLAVPGSAGASG